jgi:diaminopimelate decarboxylase
MSFKSNFLEVGQAERLVSRYGTPLFVYSRRVLEAQADAVLAIPTPYGLTVRFAMKANPNPEILRVFREQGIKIDASSGYEAELALSEGYEPEDILLTSQQLAHNLDELVSKGVQFNATSLRQLEEYANLFPDTEVGVRINPGIGSGHSAKVNVGGVTSSFGIWHEYTSEVLTIAANNGLKITRLHTHIGAGTDPEVWERVAQVSLDLAKRFPNVRALNLGGGFKVARMDDEADADMKKIGTAIAVQLKQFKQETGRELHLELEPGTFLTANAGILIATIDDIVDTGKDGFTFLKLDTGMNDILRPALYGSQHPMTVVTSVKEEAPYAVVGHNCESGDMLTPAYGNPEIIEPRIMPKAELGDLVLIGGVGAYCAGMAAHGYNSFPNAKEVLV